MNDTLDSLDQGISGSGALWVYGSFIKRLLGFMRRDRIVVASGGPLQILPTPNGRVLSSTGTGSGGDSGDLDIILCMNGELHSFTVVGTDNGPIE